MLLLYNFHVYFYMLLIYNSHILTLGIPLRNAIATFTHRDSAALIFKSLTFCSAFYKADKLVLLEIV